VGQGGTAAGPGRGRPARRWMAARRAAGRAARAAGARPGPPADPPRARARRRPKPPRAAARRSAAPTAARPGPCGGGPGVSGRAMLAIERGWHARLPALRACAAGIVIRGRASKGALGSIKPIISRLRVHGSSLPQRSVPWRPRRRSSPCERAHRRIGRTLAPPPALTRASHTSRPARRGRRAHHMSVAGVYATAASRRVSASSGASSAGSPRRAGSANTPNASSAAVQQPSASLRRARAGCRRVPDAHGEVQQRRASSARPRQSGAL